MHASTVVRPTDCDAQIVAAEGQDLSWWPMDGRVSGSSYLASEWPVTRVDDRQRQIVACSRWLPYTYNRWLEGRAYAGSLSFPEEEDNDGN